MTSNLARSTYEQWMSEGLKPTLDQLVTLNALGLEAENSKDNYDFSMLPRVAFLGDYTIWEPTIGKRIWLDKATSLFDKDDFQTQLFLTAFSLNCPDNELPELNNKKELVKRLMEFVESALLYLTHSEILVAIQYVMNGVSP